MITRVNPRLTTALLVGTLAAGCTQHELPRAFRRILECKNFPAPTQAMHRAIERGEPPLRDTDLAPGEGRVVFALTDADGERWHVSPPTTTARVSYRPEDTPDMKFVAQIGIDCNSEAGIGVVIIRDRPIVGPLLPGDYDLYKAGIDVVTFEQGTTVTEGQPHEISGFLRITEATDDRISGYVDGGGSGPIHSYWQHYDMKTDFTLVGFAFRDVPQY